jgi:imidazoleglycerol-phosphate dehydratase
MPGRKALVERKTKDTRISVSLELDGSGEYNISTGVGFFDHMLTALSKHGLFDMEIKAQGDLEIDPHHTVEDVGIVIGKAIAEALGDMKGIVRYGWAAVPMDDLWCLHP